jgi:hypothetical protein
MVTEYFAQRLDKSSMSLSAMFGIMTTLNSIVAIISGVVGEGLVAATGTKVSPFMMAIVCLGLAAWLMIRNWVSRCLSNFISLQQFANQLIIDRKLRRQCRSQKARNPGEIHSENPMARFVPIISHPFQFTPYQ